MATRVISRVLVLAVIVFWLKTVMGFPHGYRMNEEYLFIFVKPCHDTTLSFERSFVLDYKYFFLMTIAFIKLIISFVIG